MHEDNRTNGGRGISEVCAILHPPSAWVEVDGVGATASNWLANCYELRRMKLGQSLREPCKIRFYTRDLADWWGALRRSLTRIREEFCNVTSEIPWPI